MFFCSLGLQPLHPWLIHYKVIFSPVHDKVFLSEFLLPSFKGKWTLVLAQALSFHLYTYFPPHPFKTEDCPWLSFLLCFHSIFSAYPFPITYKYAQVSYKIEIPKFCVTLKTPQDSLPLKPQLTKRTVYTVSSLVSSILFNLIFKKHFI